MPAIPEKSATAQVTSLPSLAGLSGNLAARPINGASTRPDDIQIVWNSAAKQFELTTEVVLPDSLANVFDFFADAFNLELITPPFLNFRVETDAPIDIKQGTLIDYRLRLHGFPIRWRSEICEWEPGVRFVDTQIRGPYKHWWHEHTFFEIDQQTTRMVDRVLYTVPGGKWINNFFVEKNLRRIFGYRQQIISKIFQGDLDCEDCGC